MINSIEVSIFNDGSKFWISNKWVPVSNVWIPVLHRVSGPAIIESDGSLEYWINGKEISAYEQLFLSNLEAIHD